MKSAHHKPRSENDPTTRLYRSTCETVQRLDHQLRRLTSFGSLFSDDLTDLRSKLKDYCERLIFADPVKYGKKAEDMLWYKVYYEFFHRCKQNKKRLKDSAYYQNILHNHLLAAIGFYHHLMQRIQIEYHIDLDGQVNVHSVNHQKGSKNERLQKYQETISVDQNILSWAKTSCHRILIYLGDLARYIAELLPDVYPEVENRHLSERYYLQAFCMNVRNGTPWNQMGSLAANRFDAAYNYMRCLSSIERFDAAEGNLIRIFTKNDPLVREIESGLSTSSRVTGLSRFMVKFLKLCEMFFFGSDENLAKYCQDALQDFDVCFSPNNELEEVIEENGKRIVIKKDEVLFKATLMCVMCISKLRERENVDVPIATAFSLALYTSIVRFTINHLMSAIYGNVNGTIMQAVEEKQVVQAQKFIVEETVGSKTYLESKKKNSSKRNSMKKKKSYNLGNLRRRRKISNTSQDDSEQSDVEGLEIAESDEENGLNSDASQNGSCSSESLSEREDEILCEEINLQNQTKSLSSSDIFIDDPDVFVDSIVQEDFNSEVLKAAGCNDDPFTKHSDVFLPAEKLFEALDKNKLLASLKILVNWLSINKDMLQLCSQSLEYFFGGLIELFNLLLKLENQLSNSHDFSRLNRNSRDWMQAFPLPEDILVQGFPALEAIHSRLSFDVLRSKALQLNEQVFLRIQCILSYGDSLCYDPKSSIHYNKEKDLFYIDQHKEAKPDIIQKIPKTPNNNKLTVDGASADMGDQRQQLMQEMAHLWLKDEVNNLEKSIKKSSSPQLPPLLVADACALSDHLPFLKQLVATKKFIIIVPNIVIDNLDQVKKKSAGAREAIRWLEYVFQKGNRHIRAQRLNERCPVNPIKYPKRKDKDSWDFFQILECCHFLAQQQQTVLQSNSSFVTLIVGTQHQLPGNAVPLALSLNVSMENIESFFSKWHTSSKKPG